ncbi:MAG: hypothetical protein FWE62_00880 [Firmicutes bacterium]|nr:hypothetical protein [Bacillota bacterium]
MEPVIHIITYAVSVVIALIAGWQTVKAKISETSLKRVGGKVEIIPLIYEAILTVEKIMDGCPDGENKYIHGQKKKKAAIELVLGECAKRQISHDYSYISNKIEEIFIVIKDFENKLKADLAPR